jgi:hypothetical protein
MLFCLLELLPLPAIPALGRLRQEDCQFKASLGYRVRPYLKKETNKTISVVGVLDCRV